MSMTRLPLATRAKLVAKAHESCGRWKCLIAAMQDLADTEESIQACAAAICDWLGSIRTSYLSDLF